MTKKLPRIHTKLLSLFFLGAALIPYTSAADVVVHHKTDLMPSSKSRYMTELERMPHHNTVVELFNAMDSKGTLKLASTYDISRFENAIYDQGQLGSCTANGISGAIAMDMSLEHWTGINKFVPSRLFEYHNTLLVTGQNPVTQDTGASIADAIKAAYSYGFMDEVKYPYTDNSVGFTKTPPKALYNLAKNFSITHSDIPLDIDHFKLVLSQNNGVVIGTTVYQEIQDIGSNGIMAMPSTDGQSIGGHCLVVVGLNDDADDGSGGTGLLKLRNSWGANFGDKGHIYMPYAFAFGNDEIGAGNFSESWGINSIAHK